MERVERTSWALTDTFEVTSEGVGRVSIPTTEWDAVCSEYSAPTAVLVTYVTTSATVYFVRSGSALTESTLKVSTTIQDPTHYGPCRRSHVPDLYFSQAATVKCTWMPLLDEG